MQVGDLSGKYGDLAMKTDVSGSFVDPSLSLFGRLSVVRTGHCTGRELLGEPSGEQRNQSEVLSIH